MNKEKRRLGDEEGRHVRELKKEMCEKREG